MTRNDWIGAAQRWLDKEARIEASAQIAAHRKAGRAVSTFRYNPPEWQRSAVAAIGRGDEEGFKAIKLAEITYR